MNILSSFIAALGLSMDNLAVALAAGSVRCQAPRWILLQLSTLFALAHFAMFSLGYAGGRGVQHLRAVGPWLGCVILVILGVHMVVVSRTDDSVNVTPILFSSRRVQITLAVGTSLDALFAGAGLAISSWPFWSTVLAITGCVFATSWGGFYMGNRLGRMFGRNMETAGGLVLILLGAKLLLGGAGI